MDEKMKIKKTIQPRIRSPIFFGLFKKPEKD